MRTIPAALQTHLNGKTTTLAWCWRITRSDLVVIGFTDHDLDLSFDGTTFEADSGLIGSELEESLGLSVDNQELEGAVSSDDITESDIAAGLYDNAIVEVWRVNWAATSQRVLIKVGRLGELTRGKTSFIAEFRSLAADLDQPVGRVYGYKCDAVVGDARCQVDLDQAAFKGSATVASSGARNSLKTTGLSAFANAWFDHGVITFTSGANNGRSYPVKGHFAGSTQSLVLWEPAAADIEAGDGFDVTAGCDLLFKTCKDKFDNAVNFRGFPHIPNDDTIFQHPEVGDAGLDGGGNFLGKD